MPPTRVRHFVRADCPRTPPNKELISNIQSTIKPKTERAGPVTKPQNRPILPATAFKRRAHTPDQSSITIPSKAGSTPAGSAARKV